jgi:hypothetical protein
MEDRIVKLLTRGRNPGDSIETVEIGNDFGQSCRNNGLIESDEED